MGKVVDYSKELNFNSLNGEVWKNILKYITVTGNIYYFRTGDYEISNFGRVRSNITNKILKWHVFRPNKNLKYRITQITLRDIDNKRRTIILPRLVALYFCHNDDPIHNKIVNHKDESPSKLYLPVNNCSSNLEWCDYKYNVNYGEGLVNMVKTNKERNNYEKTAKTNKENGLYERFSKERSKPIKQYNLNGDFIKEWSSIWVAGNETGYAMSAIRRCCKGKQKTAYEYLWRYKQ